MKLWYSKTSPYVRKVLAVIAHHQLNDRVELALIQSSFDPNSPHNRDNPLGRVPALQLENGEWLFGSLLICEYLDQVGTNGSLFGDNQSRWQILQLHSLADGIMENTMPMLAEKMLRPEAEWWTSRHAQLSERNARSFVALEQALVPFGETLNIGTITALCLIDWGQFRADKLGLDLNQVAPKLVKWAQAMNQRYPFFAESQPR